MFCSIIPTQVYFFLIAVLRQSQCGQYCVGNPEPSTGCWQPLPHTAAEEAIMSWTRTHSSRIGERLLGHCAAIARSAGKEPNMNMH